jgi:hypothetical protein
MDECAFAWTRKAPALRPAHACAARSKRRSARRDRRTRFSVSGKREGCPAGLTSSPTRRRILRVMGYRTIHKGRRRSRAGSIGRPGQRRSEQQEQDHNNCGKMLVRRHAELVARPFVDTKVHCRRDS